MDHGRTVVTIIGHAMRSVTHAPCWCIGQSGVGGRAAKASWSGIGGSGLVLGIGIKDRG